MEHPPTQTQIEHHCTLSTYSWQEHLNLLRAWADTVPCLLCGQLHPLKVHSYVDRNVRVPETCSNDTILIIVILCATAKAEDRQYTKRILPPFVVPFCVIRRDQVLEYLKAHPQGELHYRHALETLGALDKRTIRRHLAEAGRLLEEAMRETAVVLAENPFWATLPERPVGQRELEYLEAAAAEVHRARRRAFGAPRRCLPALLFVHVAGVFGRHRAPLVISMTSVLRSLVFHDTG